jgi:hypothetical protein
MTRIADLDFHEPGALFRGDGGGVAVIRRQPFEAGSAWAQVVEPGAGITAPYLLLIRRSGGIVDGELIAEDDVAAVSGDAEAVRPDRIDRDARLTLLGTFTEMQDAAAARRADTEGGRKLRADNEAIAGASFEVIGVIDDRRWRVRVGPTLASGTTLECHADDGELRLLETTAERAVLERARTGGVVITASFSERRRFGGMRTRTIDVQLGPRER